MKFDQGEHPTLKDPTPLLLLLLHPAIPFRRSAFSRAEEHATDFSCFGFSCSRRLRFLILARERGQEEEEEETEKYKTKQGGRGKKSFSRMFERGEKNAGERERERRPLHALNPLGFAFSHLSSFPSLYATLVTAHCELRLGYSSSGSSIPTSKQNILMLDAL